LSDSVKAPKRRDFYQPAAGTVGLDGLGGDAPPRFLAGDGNGNGAVPERLLRILVADDSVDSRFIIREYLKGTPYRPEEAEDGDIAVEKFKRRRYDLVLIEMHMQRVGGYSAVRELRNWEMERVLPRTPLIALTASASAEDGHQALGADYDDHLSKPLSKRTLVDAIQVWNSPVDPVALKELHDIETPDEESLLADLIDRFLSDLDPRLNAMRNAVFAGDARSLQITAHTLRGSCGYFGARRMVRLCNYLERDGRGEMSADSHEAVAELEIEATHVRLALVAARERIRAVMSCAISSIQQKDDVAR